MDQIMARTQGQNENLKADQDMLTHRLLIVERLKDMLEQQIGSDDVQNIMKLFSIETRQTLSVS